MVSSVGITLRYNSEESNCLYQIKENPEDFIVQEVVDGNICNISPIIDLDKYNKAVDFFKQPFKERISKEERKTCYSIANYHPIYRLFTKDGMFNVEVKTEDIYVFTLLKNNCSSNFVNSILARRLNVPLACIQTGGTKDKRAITLQEFSVKCSFEKLISYAFALTKNDKLKIKSLGYKHEFENINEEIRNLISEFVDINDVEVNEEIAIYNIRRGSSKKLGDLDGNKFTVKIKDLKKPSITSTKFLNYFGPQRFGLNLNNHLVGEKILNQEFDEAIDMILNDRNSESNSYNHTQRLIIKLKEANNKSKYIIDRLPRNIKMIYMHSYQSYIFNKAVNERLSNGAPVVDEDKVLKDGAFVNVRGDESIEDIYLPLEIMNDKFLKGGFRKMIEEIESLRIEEHKDAVIFEFYLKKSCYATIALRELIGGAVKDENSP